MLVSSFIGSNRDFLAWLAAQRYDNVVSLAEWRKTRCPKRKKTASRAAIKNPTFPSIA